MTLRVHQSCMLPAPVLLLECAVTLRLIRVRSSLVENMHTPLRWFEMEPYSVIQSGLALNLQ